MAKLTMILLLFLAANSVACMEEVCKRIAASHVTQFGGDYVNRYNMCMHGWDEDHPSVQSCTYKKKRALEEKLEREFRESPEEKERKRKERAKFVEDSINAYNELHANDYYNRCGKSFINKKGIKVRKCSDRNGYEIKEYEEAYDASKEIFTNDVVPVYNGEGLEIAKYYPDNNTRYGSLVCSGVAHSSVRGQTVIKVKACETRR